MSEEKHDKINDAKKHTIVGPPRPGALDQGANLQAVVNSTGDAARVLVPPPALVQESDFAARRVVEGVEGEVNYKEMGEYLGDDIPSGDNQSIELNLPPSSFTKISCIGEALELADDVDITMKNQTNSPTWTVNGEDKQSGFKFLVDGMMVELRTEGKKGYLVISNPGNQKSNLSIRRKQSYAMDVTHLLSQEAVAITDMDSLKARTQNGKSFRVKEASIISRFLRGGENALNLDQNSGGKITVPNGDILVIGKDEVKVMVAANGVNLEWKSKRFDLPEGKLMRLGNVVIAYEAYNEGGIFHLFNEAEQVPLSLKVKDKRIFLNFLTN